MADAAAARREARRKRILENSHNRLQLISGKNSEEIARESTNASPIPPPPYESNVLPDSSVSSDYPLLNGVLAGLDSVQELTESLASSHDVVAAGDGEAVNDLAGFIPSLPLEEPQVSPWKNLITLKYDVVLLSLLLQFIHSVASVPYENTYFFLPLLIYSITKIAWLPKQNSSIANALLLLNGASPGRLYNMLEVLHWTGIICQDVCIYLFTTICIQSLFITLKESFIT